MEANELRIGNFVYVDKGAIWKVVEISSWDKQTCVSKPCSDGYSLEDNYGINRLSGIPLTEEILLKAGFKKTGDEYLFDNDIIYYLNEFSWNMGDISYNGSDDWFECKNVHQLQNFYFALTGEELEIEL